MTHQTWRMVDVLHHIKTLSLEIIRVNRPGWEVMMFAGDASIDDVIEEGEDETWFSIGMTREENTSQAMWRSIGYPYL